MKAVLYDKFGGPEVLRVAEVPAPEPARGEVLVAVRSASVNPVDWKIREGQLKFIMGRKFPKGLGGDFAGEVAKVGPGVSRFKAGDAVFGNANQTKGKIGGYAEFLSVPEDRLTAKPSGLGYDEAAALPIAAGTALQCLRDAGKLKEGQTVLINGASGGVGAFAVQIARIMNLKSTAFCGEKNMEFVKSLGADRVFDYKKVSPLSLGEKFDMFFDVAPASSYGEARKVLSERGTYVTTLPMTDAIFAMLTNVFRKQKSKVFLLKDNPEDFALLARWVAEGKLSVEIGHRFPLDEIKKAHEISETHHVRGKIIVAVKPGTNP